MQSVLQSPEFLLLTRSIASSDFSNLISQSIIDENRLSKLMHRHRVGQLAYAKLSSTAFLSESFHEHWKLEVFKNQKSALLIKKFQYGLSERLNSKSIPHVYLKGIELSDRFYGDLALRHVLDLDILVSEDDMDVASGILTQLGLQLDPAYAELTKRQKKFLRYVDHDLTFFGDGEVVPQLVELHWKWRGALGGFSLNEVRNLNDEELFLYLVTHGTEHAWFRLKWLVDVLMMMHQVTMSWKTLREKAIQLKCLTHVEVTLQVLKGVFNMDIPKEFAYVDSKNLHSKKLNYIFSLIASEEGFNSNDSRRLSHFSYLQSLSTRKLNFQFLMKYATSPKDWQLMPLPDLLFFMYFPMKLILWLYRRIKR